MSRSHANLVVSILLLVCLLPMASWLLVVLAAVTLPGINIPWSYGLWWDASDMAFTNWRLLVPVGGSAAFAVFCTVLLFWALLHTNRVGVRRGWWVNTPRPVEPGASDNHGHSEWMSMRQARRELRPGQDGSPYVVIGEAWRVDQSRVAHLRFRARPTGNRTWGKGGKARLLVDPSNEGGAPHFIIFGGTGSGKTTATVTRALHWDGPLVILDPSREIGPIITRARYNMGDRIIRIGPRSGSMNVLAGIDPSAPDATQRLLSAVESVCGPENRERDRNAIFDDAGRNMVAAVLGHLLWDATLPPEHRTLAFFRELISAPQEDMRAMLMGIYRSSRCSTARLIAGTLTALPDETFGSAYFSMSQMIAWMFDDDLVECLSSADFQASDLLRQRMTVFIQVPPDTMQTRPQVARVILDALAWAFINADGLYRRRCLFLVDEASKLGRMQAIELIRDMGRKYGITLGMNYLNEGEIEEVWGRHGLARWFSNLSWRGYCAISDRSTAEGVSKDAGSLGVVALSESDNEGKSGRSLERASKSAGEGESRHEISRPLIRAEELARMRRDELVVIRGGSLPLRCSQPFYFRRRELVRLVANNRFNRDDGPWTIKIELRRIVKNLLPPGKSPALRRIGTRQT